MKDAKAADRALRGLGNGADRFPRQARGFDASTRRMSGGIKSVGLAAAGGAVAGLYALGGAARLVASEYQESAKVGAQTDAAIRSTGGAAKVTSAQVGDLATSISRKTALDDEQVQSAANMLLTFTNVRNEVGKGNDVFSQATRTVTDMSVALGTDSKKSAIQLGKALNDPVKGITALSRVGVTFTATQKKTIGSLVSSGKRLDAQKIILRELNREFGGSAAAAATPIDRLRTDTNNLAESIGYLAAPIVTKGITALDRLVQGVQTGRGLGGVLARTAKGAAGTVGTLARGSGGKDGGAVGFLRSKVLPAALAVGQQVAAALAPALPFLQGMLPLLRGIGEGVLGSVVAIFRVAIPVIGVTSRALGWLGTNVLRPLAPVLLNVGRLIGFVFGPGIIGRAIGLVGRFGKLSAKAGSYLIPFGSRLRALGAALSRLAGRGRAAMNRLVGAIRGGASQLASAAKAGASRLLGAYTYVPRRMLAVGRRATSAIARGLRSAPGQLVAAAKWVGRQVVDGILAVIKQAPGQIAGAITSVVPGPVKGVVSKGLGLLGVDTKAGGGRSRGGVTLVGERGPELVDLPGGSHVTTARGTRSALAGSMAAGSSGHLGTVVVNTMLDSKVLHSGIYKVERRLQAAT